MATLARTPTPTLTPTPAPSAPPAYDETYTYDTLGNLITKAGVSYSYGSTGAGTGTGPHQARSVGGASYTYDANGNLTSGGGRTFTWTADNLPATVTSGGVTESYTYGFLIHTNSRRSTCCCWCGSCGAAQPPALAARRGEQCMP